MQRNTKRSTASTFASLEAALNAAKTSGKRVSISGIAKAAGVDPSLIHHCYPQILAAIRAVSGVKNREAVTLMKDELIGAKLSLRSLWVENKLLREDLAKLSSINLALQVRLDALESGVRALGEKPKR